MDNPEVNRTCYRCGSRRIAFEPTPMDDEDGRRIVRVYRCRDCQAIDVVDFPSGDVDLILDDRPAHDRIVRPSTYLVAD